MERCSECNSTADQFEWTHNNVADVAVAADIMHIIDYNVKICLNIMHINFTVFLLLIFIFSHTEHFISSIVVAWFGIADDDFW